MCKQFLNSDQHTKQWILLFNYIMLLNFYIKNYLSAGTKDYGLEETN